MAENNEEQEFNSAWDEEEAPETETPEEPEEGQAEPESEEQPEEEPEGEPEEPEEPEEPPEEAQRRKSWEGRLRKREEELRAKEQELLALQQQEPPKQETPEIDEDDPEWMELVDELGEDLALKVRNQSKKVTQNALESEIDKVRQEMRQSIEPLTQQQQEAQARQHTQTILQAHPDAFDLVQRGEIQAWVEDQPRYLQPAYQQMVEQGSAEDVVDMLNTFKQSRGKAPQRKAPSQAVRSRKGGRVRTAAAPKDDFDAAWDEAP